MTSLQPPTVLIAEDDPMLREAYVTILQHAGFQIIQAEDGRQALDKAEHEVPDLMILDMLMPGKSGLEVLRDERMQSVRSRIKVIAFTNLSDPETLEELQQLGVDRYLLKASLLPQMLIDHVRQVLAGVARRDVCIPSYS